MKKLERMDETSPEMDARMDEIAEEWIKYGLSVEPADRAAAEEGMGLAYGAAGLEAPEIVVWAGSPYAGMLAAAMLTNVRTETEESLRTKARSTGRAKRESPEVERCAAAVAEALSARLGVPDRGGLRAALLSNPLTPRNQFSNTVYGQHDAGWLSFYAFFAEYLEGLDEIQGLLQVARNSGWFVPFENAVVMTERPCKIHLDVRGELHNETGPSLSYPDGFSLYNWHGTPVPEDLVTTGWNTSRILKEPNAEIRRCAIERMGWDRFVTEAQLSMVGTPVADPGNDNQTLTLYDVPEAIYETAVRVLICTNGTIERDGTRRKFGLTCPATISDPIEAAAWMYDIPVAAYREMEVRR